MSKLHLVTALPVEARPLIDYFRLKKLEDTVFPIFENRNVRLIVSGIGKVSSASAVSYLQGRFLDDAVWINVGFSGHLDSSIGSAYLVHKISDHTFRESFYPTFLKKPPFPTHALYSFDHPVRDYPKDLLVDMEGFGFYLAANRFTSIEFVHCFKIVSDNQNNPFNPSKSHLVSLIAPHLPLLEDFIMDLKSKQEKMMGSSRHLLIFQSLIEKFHFTQNEKHALKKSLRAYLLLYRNLEEKPFQKGSECLKYLDEKIRSHAFSNPLF